MLRPDMCMDWGVEVEDHVLLGRLMVGKISYLRWRSIDPSDYHLTKNGSIGVRYGLLNSAKTIKRHRDVGRA